jgi:methanogenic corrinoid protein MtbC1
MTNLPPLPTSHPAGSPAVAMGIADVERELRLGKDTLRAWERRYGFPVPERDAQGERLYPAEQIVRLRQIRRLLDAGERPGRVVPLAPEALAEHLARLDALMYAAAARPDADPAIDEAMAALEAHDLPALRRVLMAAQWRLGLADFVRQVAAPLSARAGEAWLGGRLRVYEEHLLSEVMATVLRAALAGAAGTVTGAAPRVLLATLPGESHALPLLMAEALLMIEGADPVNLGAQTPVVDLVDACAGLRIDVLLLGLTATRPGPALTRQLEDLRQRLPAGTALWAGGGPPLPPRWRPEGVRFVARLDGLGEAAREWRLAHGRPAG